MWDELLAIYSLSSLLLAIENHRRMTVQYELYGQGQRRTGRVLIAAKERVPLYKEVRGRPLFFFFSTEPVGWPNMVEKKNKTGFLRIAGLDGRAVRS